MKSTLQSTTDLVLQLECLSEDEIKKLFPNKFFFADKNDFKDIKSMKMLANKCIFYQISLANSIFLKKELQLGMFTPCDLNNNPINEPPFTKYPNGTKIYSVGSKYIDEWREAQSRVLFNGFSLQNEKQWIEYYGGLRVFVATNISEKMASVVFRENQNPKTIESLLKWNIELTETAQSQIYV